MGTLSRVIDLWVGLWVAKSLVYEDKPETIDAFKANILRNIVDISPQLLLYRKYQPKIQVKIGPSLLFSAN